MSSRSLKITGAVLVILIAALVVTPGVIGRNVSELAISNTLGMLPPEVQAQIEIRENTVNSGWFRSSAQLELEYTALGALPLNMQLDAQIQHGPILFTPAGLAFGLVYAQIDPIFDSAEIREALSELPFPLPSTQIGLRAGFRGDLYATVDVGNIDFEDAAGELNFAGMQMQFNAYADQSAEFSLTMGALSARESGTSFEFSIQSLAVASYSAQINDLLAPNSAHLAMPRFESAAPFPLTLTNFNADSRLQPSSAGPELTDTYGHLQIENIESDLPLTALTWTLEINEIRNDLFRRYYLLMTELQNEINNNTGTATSQLGESAQELTLLLLQNRIVLNNSIGATAYEGEHSIDLRLLWQGLPDLTEFARMDVGSALAALELNLDASLDLEAIMRSPLASLVDPYVQQGYLQLDNGHILIKASLVNSVLTVNGERLALDGLF